MLQLLRLPARPLVWSNTHQLLLLTLLGGASFAFATVQHVIGIAVWLAPICLLRVIRLAPNRYGALAVFIGLLSGASYALSGYIDPDPPVWLTYGIALSYAILFWLPYLADLAIATRLNGWMRQLVFPSAYVALDWALRWHPFPNFGSPAYAQINHLALAQSAALVGIWGITWLTMWGAAALNHGWEARWSRTSLMASCLPFALVCGAVLGYGQWRLSESSPSRSVQTALIVPDRTQWSYPAVQEIAQADPRERAAFASRMEPVIEQLFADSQAAARAGAKLVVWAENAAFVPSEYAPALRIRAAALAREEQIYLQIGLSTILASDQFPYATNHAILYTPSGAESWDYQKGHLVPVGDAAEMAPGARIIPLAETEIGNLSTIICYDDTHISYVQQLSGSQSDLLLIPSDDWFAAREDHAAISRYRAIEQGVAIVRPGAKGISLVSDRYGRELARSDYYQAAPGALLLVDVPIDGQPTLYSRIGDSFAYAALLMLFGLAVWRLRQPTPA